MAIPIHITGHTTVITITMAGIITVAIIMADIMVATTTIVTDKQI
jgi:hypothetical protein